MSNSRTFTLNGGSLQNDGIFRLDSTGSTTILGIASGMTLEGTGVLEMNDLEQNRITGNTNAVQTQTTGHTIRGSGNIGFSAIGLDNEFGAIEAQAGGTVAITGSTTRIVGGTLTGDGAFTLGGNAALVDLINEGDITLSLPVGNTSGQIEGTIVNEGSILLDAVGGFVLLNTAGDTTLTGTGVVEMNDDFRNRITGNTNDVLTQTAGHTIRGSDNIGFSTIGLDNEGVIEAVGDAGLTLQLRTADGVTRRNAGTPVRCAQRMGAC